MSAIVYPVYDIAMNLKRTLEEALPSGVPGYVLMDPLEVWSHQHDVAFTVMPHEPPAPAASQELGQVTQEEHWRWTVYLMVGRGTDYEESLQIVQELGGAVIAALTGSTPESKCDQIERGEAGFRGFVENGIVWGFSFWHTRYTGEEP